MSTLGAVRHPGFISDFIHQKSNIITLNHNNKSEIIPAFLVLRLQMVHCGISWARWIVSAMMTWLQNGRLPKYRALCREESVDMYCISDMYRLIVTEYFFFLAAYIQYDK